MKITSIILLIVLFACNSKPYESNLNLSSEKTFIKENLVSITPPISFALLSDSSFIVLTENFQLIKYSKSGEQEKIINNIGQGELELYSPGIVKPFGDGFMVWCRNLMKMVEFDSEGNPVAEFFGFDHSINNFIVKNKLLFTYINTLDGKPFIQIYDLNKKKIVGKLGYTEKEQVIANLYSCGGGLTFFLDQVLFMPSHNLTFYSSKLSNLEKFNIDIISDDDFNELNFDSDPSDLINNNQRKAIELSMSSGVITGIYTLGDRLAVFGRVGKMNLLDNMVNSKNKKQFVWLLDRNFNILGKYFTELDLSSISCKLISNVNNQIYRIIEKEGEIEMEYYFEKMTFRVLE